MSLYKGRRGHQARGDEGQNVRKTGTRTNVARKKLQHRLYKIVEQFVDLRA